MVFSSFTPVVHFGLLSAMVMLLAFGASFLLTPVMLSFTRLITLWDLLSLRLRAQIGERCPLFQDMTRRQIKRIALMGELRDYAEGEAVIRREVLDKMLIIVLDGRIDYRIERMDHSLLERRLLGMGDVCGILSFVSDGRRSVTAVAQRPCQVLCLNWQGIQRVSRYFPRSSVLLFRNLPAILGERMHDRLLREGAVFPKLERWDHHVS